MVRQTLELGQHKLTCVGRSYDEEEVNIDQLLSIDYRNLEKEALTFSVVLHRFGEMEVHAEKMVKEADLALRVWKARVRQEIIEEFQEEISDPSNSRKKYTNDDIDAATRLRPKYSILYQAKFRAEKLKGYINSLYWAAKSKNDKLKEFDLSFLHKSGDILIEDLEGEFNHVELHVRKNKF